MKRLNHKFQIGDTAYHKTDGVIKIIDRCYTYTEGKQYLGENQLWYSESKLETMDLTTEEGRKAALLALMSDFIAEVHEQFNGFHEKLSVRINDRIVEIGVHDPEKSKGVYMAHQWGSKVELYPDSIDFGGEPAPAKINFGSSGSFTPDAPEYWRTIHAAIILQNWDEFVKLVNQCCQKYTELHNDIIKVNENAK